MTSRCYGSMVALAVVMGVSLLAPSLVAAQESAPAAEKRWDPPRTPDGQPDIQGYWGQRSDITTYSIQAGFEDRDEHTRIGGQNPQKGRPIIDPADGKIPYQPWAAGTADVSPRTAPETVEARILRSRVSRCFLEGVPRINYQGNMRILQFPKYIVIMHEFGHHYRVIYLDGRPPSATP